MAKENRNEIVAVEATVVEARQIMPVDNRTSLMAAAGIPANLTNEDAIGFVADAILAEIAAKPKDQLTEVDAFAVKAALGSKIAPTAGQEVLGHLQNAGLL